VPVVSAAPKYGGTLKIVIIAGPQTPGGWPPDVFGPDAVSYQFCMESLLRGDNKGGVLPWLAESYKIADDLKSITFTLRKDVKFHDGTDFNAQAAKWNLDQTIAAKKVNTWDSVDLIDDYTIRVNFTRWANNNLNTFADSNYTWMVSPTAYQKNGIDWMRNNPVGTGPFKFVSFQRDVNYKVTRNPDYWIKDRPYLDGIEIMYVADSMTQKSIMQSGGADVLQAEPGKTAMDFQAQGFNFVNQIITTYCFLPDSAHADSPYANQKVREAVEYAIDREAIAKAFSYGFWTAPYQIPAPASAAYNPDFSLGRKHDLAKAKQLLTEAGYPNGFKTTILGNPAIPRDITVAVQSYLQAANIQAEIIFPANMGGFIENSNSLNNVLVMQPIMSFSNYNSTIEQFLLGKDSLWNHNFLASPEFLKLRETSLYAPTMDITLIRAATDQLTREAAAIPLAHAGLGWIMNPSVKDSGNLERSSSDSFKSEQMWLDK